MCTCVAGSVEETHILTFSEHARLDQCLDGADASACSKNIQQPGLMSPCETVDRPAKPEQGAASLSSGKTVRVEAERWQIHSCHKRSYKFCYNTRTQTSSNFKYSTSNLKSRLPTAHARPTLTPSTLKPITYALAAFHLPPPEHVMGGMDRPAWIKAAQALRSSHQSSPQECWHLFAQSPPPTLMRLVHPDAVGHNESFAAPRKHPPDQEVQVATLSDLANSQLPLCHQTCRY